MEDQKKRKQARDPSGCFVRNEQSHKAPCISGDIPFVLFVCSLVTSLLSLWWAQGRLLCLVCPPFLACIDFRIVHPPGSRSRRHLCSLALECSLQPKAKMTLESMDSQDAQRVQRMRNVVPRSLWLQVVMFFQTSGDIVSKRKHAQLDRLYRKEGNMRLCPVSVCLNDCATDFKG